MLVIIRVQSNVEITAVQDLIRKFTTWAFSLNHDSNQAPTFEKLEEELATLPGIYSPPHGRLLLAMQDGQPAGCVALNGHDDLICELKRMYVRPAFRGQGIGRALVRILTEEARRAGFERMLLSSHISMKKAHEIYQTFGFKKVGPPDDFPEKFKSSVVFMECELLEKD